MPAPTTYSLLDVIFIFNHPLLSAPITASGNMGVGKLSISMSQDRTQMDQSGDGAVMISAKPGRLGLLSVEVQQTSLIHAALLDWYNLLDAAMANNQVTLWAAATAEVRCFGMRKTHIFSGVAPQKLPDQPYEANGQNYTWNLPAAEVQNLNI